MAASALPPVEHAMKRRIRFVAVMLLAGVALGTTTGCDALSIVFASLNLAGAIVDAAS